MPRTQQFAECAYCTAPIDDEEEAIAVHVVPLDRGGCEHLANTVDICHDCAEEVGSRTAVEFWGHQQWEEDASERGVSAFDHEGWTLEQRGEVLQRVAFWEARARRHLERHHQRTARWE